MQLHLQQSVGVRIEYADVIRSFSSGNAHQSLGCVCVLTGIDSHGQLIHARDVSVRVPTPVLVFTPRHVKTSSSSFYSPLASSFFYFLSVVSLIFTFLFSSIDVCYFVPIFQFHIHYPGSCLFSPFTISCQISLSQPQTFKELSLKA